MFKKLREKRGLSREHLLGWPASARIAFRYTKTGTADWAGQRHQTRPRSRRGHRGDRGGGRDGEAREEVTTQKNQEMNVATGGELNDPESYAGAVRVITNWNHKKPSAPPGTTGPAGHRGARGSIGRLADATGIPRAVRQVTQTSPQPLLVFSTHSGETTTSSGLNMRPLPPCY